jgi:AcrR family transcriptional regulator
MPREAALITPEREILRIRSLEVGVQSVRRLDETLPSRWRIGPERSAAEIAFAEALERLLRPHPLHEISVEMILGEAGLSRSTFYSYFSDKNELMTMLAGQVYDEMFKSISPWWTAGGAGTRELLRTSLRNAVEAWGRYGPVLAATMETEHAAPGLHKVWLQALDRATIAIAEEIDRERSRGKAPPGPPAEAVAGVIAHAAERFLYVSERGLSPAMPDLDAVADMLLVMGVVAVYGPAGSATEAA